MSEMSWRDAIEQALRDHDEPMHYTDIATAIVESGYRQNVGATPATTVAANLSESLSARRRSPFVKVSRGVYALREQIDRSAHSADERNPAEVDAEDLGLINAFGMFWDRKAVQWDVKPVQLWGIQLVGTQPTDFASQAGVYILYDVHRAVYVGRVTEPRLGVRLSEHTRDRLKGRWDRFSWFGVRSVKSTGALAPVPKAGIRLPTLIATMEALLIEGLEPPQNRRQGDGFKAVEFIQHAES